MGDTAKRARLEASAASAVLIKPDLRSKIDTMKSAASKREPFSDGELDAAVASLKSLAPEADLDWSALRSLYADRAHINHKEWAETCVSAERMADILGGPDDAAFRKIFSRVLEDGNWDATAASPRPADAKPWLVLVTGLNGIRKTTSVHQPWFKELLQQALAEQYVGEAEALLPAGGDSFFRQLDYMIATLALEEFKVLYTIDDVALYAEYKEAIFARYRTMAEMLGVLLVRAAQAKGLNLMVETSGRDVGMYQYVEHLQPDDAYRKLVVNFQINDLSYAERSVDTRMLGEMAAGKAALATAESAPIGLVKSNAGGPYGSSVLAGVQADSVKVWEKIINGGKGDVGDGWYKAAIRIEARETAPWTAKAVLSTELAPFEFGPPPS